MTSSTLPGQGAPRVVRPVLSLLGVAVPAVALATLALATASGVTRLSDIDYHTEFVNGSWWSAGCLLVLPVFLVARAHPRLAAAAVLIAAVPQFVTARIGVVRTGEAGWGSGLEALGYVWAVLMTLMFVGAAVAGTLARRRRPARV